MVICSVSERKSTAEHPEASKYTIAIYNNYVEDTFTDARESSRTHNLSVEKTLQQALYCTGQNGLSEDQQ